MIEIKGCNVTVMVTDLDISIRFYTEILGLKLKNRFGDHWADIEGPGITIGLHPSSQEYIRSDNLQIGFRVDDLENTISEMRRENVEFKMLGDDNVRLAPFMDPDGNTLYLVQT